ncbi:MAG: FAD/NAD(P)-binding protein [Nocardioidaceae bacterium]
MQNESQRVLVVGGGAAAVVTSAALLEREPGLDVVIVERSGPVGPGLAYGTAEPLHLLNNYAGRMSALEADPGHLVRWCRDRGTPATEETFLPRSVYGRYLAELAEALPVRRTQDEVCSVVDGGTSYLATCASGARIEADTVVLALGNPPPRPMPALEAASRHYVGNPWTPDLLDRIADGDEVLLVGTGLTMVDVAAQIGRHRPRARMFAVSRHGRLPLRHLPAGPGPAAPFAAEATTLPGLLAAVRTRLAAGVDWRDLVEEVKLVANDLWAGLGEDGQRRFVRHAARSWEVVRHRMAPPMAAVVDELRSEGRLTVTAAPHADPAAYDVTVNCTGPAPVSTAGWNPLVDDLASRGMLLPDRHGLGVDISNDGALLDGSGAAARGLYVVGAGRRGREWEVAAVPDIRRQATALAARLCADAARVGALVG